MKKLYKFKRDCGRMGKLIGVFAAQEADVLDSIGEDLYFGECLGKHSEIYGPLLESELKILSEDQDFIEKFIAIVGDVGYNPLRYLKENYE